MPLIALTSKLFNIPLEYQIEVIDNIDFTNKLVAIVEVFVINLGHEAFPPYFPWRKLLESDIELTLFPIFHGHR